MIRLVAADAGEGKTKSLIKMANDSAKITKGHIVYLDGDSSHMYDLDHVIRYTNISEYPLTEDSEFFGFMCGVLSEDSDIDEIYADGLLKLAHLEEIANATDLVDKLKALSDKFQVRFVFSVCCDVNALPENMKAYVVNA
jgi:hypothetical protein